MRSNLEPQITQPFESAILLVYLLAMLQPSVITVLLHAHAVVQSLNELLDW